jgi:hypothetical protein
MILVDGTTLSSPITIMAFSSPTSWNRAPSLLVPWQEVRLSDVHTLQSSTSIRKPVLQYLLSNTLRGSQCLLACQVGVPSWLVHIWVSIFCNSETCTILSDNEIKLYIQWEGSRAVSPPWCWNSWNSEFPLQVQFTMLGQSLSVMAASTVENPCVLISLHCLSWFSLLQFGLERAGNVESRLY